MAKEFSQRSKCAFFILEILLKELITYLAKSLATQPDQVSVAERTGEKGLTLELTVADEDLNYLIGKQGRTVKAMRSLLLAASAPKAERFSLQIVSNAEPGKSDLSTDNPAPLGHSESINNE